MFVKRRSDPGGAVGFASRREGWDSESDLFLAERWRCGVTDVGSDFVSVVGPDRGERVSPPSNWSAMGQAPRMLRSTLRPRPRAYTAGRCTRRARRGRRGPRCERNLPEEENAKRRDEP